MSNDFPDGYDSTEGVVDYTQIEKAPIVEYGQNNNAS